MKVNFVQLEGQKALFNEKCVCVCVCLCLCAVIALTVLVKPRCYW